MTTTPRLPLRAFGAALLALLLLAAPRTSRAAAADDSFRDAQQALREALRDTVGHREDVTRLDTLGVALFRLARLTEAERVLAQASALAPKDQGALALLGRIAMWRGRGAEADSLLALAGDADGAARDRYTRLLAKGDWAAAAGLAESVDDVGRKPLLEKLAETQAFTLTPGKPAGTASFERAWPAPLVHAKVNGQDALFVVDPGAPDLLLDPANVRVRNVIPVSGERSLLWNGARIAAKNAFAQRFEVAGMTLTNVPAALVPLGKFSLEVNPQGERVAGVIGLSVLQKFGVTIDFKQQRLELRRPGTAYEAKGERVPFEIWGEGELTVYGSVNAGRRMALQCGTGMPGGAFGAPASVFDELGLKPGTFSNLVKGAGVFLQGRSWAQVVVPTITLGGIVRDRAPGWSGALESAEMWRHGARRDGLLGPEMFRNRRITFDWNGRAIVFEGD